MTRPAVPTYDDARLVLKLYELRREEKLRAARHWMATRFFPKSLEDVQAVLAPGHPDNVQWRMVVGYWDMAASFVVHGVLHAGLFLDSAGEMLTLWAKVEPLIAQVREKAGNPALLENVEKAIRQVPAAAERVKAIRARLPRYEQALKVGSLPSPPPPPGRG